VTSSGRLQSGKISLISAQELSGEIVRNWIGLQQDNPDLANPFFHPEFTKIIGSVRKDVELAVVESGAKIVACFPFQRRYRTVGCPVGGIISDYHGVICRQCLRFSPRGLLQHSGLTAWDFDHLPTSQLSFAPFQIVGPSPQIDLSCGYDTYVQQRREAGSQQIKKIYNLMRRVEREVGPLRFVADSSDATLLAVVLGWKSDQYRRSGKRDLFAPGWIREAVERIFATRADDWSGTLSLLYAGDRLIAGHFGMRSRQVWHYWFPSYDLEAAKYSPGLILLLKMAEYAPTVGARVIDLGKGMSPYKERLMNSSCTLASGRLELPSWGSFRRQTWRAFRSQIGNSRAGPPVRIALEWFRRNTKFLRSRRAGPWK
jgi:CelD/BcsL family acetyltransferase involved in cellulose biosynthesis